MRYFLNVYPARFVYTVLRFYTGWAESGRSSTHLLQRYRATIPAWTPTYPPTFSWDAGCVLHRTHQVFTFVGAFGNGFKPAKSNSKSKLPFWKKKRRTVMYFAEYSRLPNSLSNEPKLRFLSEIIEKL